MAARERKGRKEFLLMKPDDFEQRLQRQPLRDIPTTWREDILQTAQSTVAPRPSPIIACVHACWHELFWPCRRAWVGLAVVWTAILVVNVATRDAPKAVARQTLQSPAGMAEALKEKRRLMSELIGSVTEPAEPPRSYLPRPRSERRCQTAVA